MFAGEAGAAHLLHLVQQGHATNKPLPPHLPQSRKVQVPESSMPHPCLFFTTRGEADRLCNVDVEHIEPAWAAVDLG